MEKSIKSTLIHIGRTLLALYFLLPGIGKFIAWDDQIHLMETHNILMAPILLAVAGVLQVFGGICLLINKQVVICALGFAVMTILINLNLHDFWNSYEGVDSSHELQNFFKNLGIFAGLILLAAIYMEGKQINENTTLD